MTLGDVPFVVQRRAIITKIAGGWLCNVWLTSKGAVMGEIVWSVELSRVDYDHPDGVTRWCRYLLWDSIGISTSEALYAILNGNWTERDIVKEGDDVHPGVLHRDGQAIGIVGRGMRLKGAVELAGCPGWYWLRLWDGVKPRELRRIQGHSEYERCWGERP